MDVNQEGYDGRLAAVQQILLQFGLTASEVTPLAYVENCPFPFNNYIYKADLTAPALPESFSRGTRKHPPGTSPPPPGGVSTVVVRLSNPHAGGLNNANRVQNEVAAQQLVRQSLWAAGLPPVVVPTVYAWAPCRYPDEVPDETGFGWTVGELRPGADLDSQFDSLSPGEKEVVIRQIADIFAAVQRAEIPATVAGFCSLTFDEGGIMTGGQMPLLKGGPWESYADLWVARLMAQLKDAEESPVLRGWEAGGVRTRVDKFLDAKDGLSRALEGVDVHQRVLVHGDLTMNNMLFDRASMRITGLLDFDWSAVTHPGEEFFTGLWDVGGGLGDRTEKFHAMILSGDFAGGPPPEVLGDDEEMAKWDVARAWNAAISGKEGVRRPSNIAGMAKLQALREFEGFLCPFELSNEVLLKRASDAEKAQQRGGTEGKIIAWLEKYGF